MLKASKKILCTFLIVIMCLTSAPLDGFVGVEWPSFSEWLTGKASAADELAATGQCGDDVYWNYDSATGELVISGTGEMWDYDGFSDENPSYSVYGDSVTSVIIENGVSSIGDEAFSLLYEVTSVTISETVEHIGNFAFFSCDRLESITIPKGVTSIGGNAFDECDLLEKIIVDENNTAFSNDEYGVLLNKDKSCLIEYPYGNKSESYTIPDSVASIARYAFACCSLKSVTIPDSVVTIGYGAFRECRNLSQIVMGNGIKEIDDAAFYMCTSLESISIPYGVVTIWWETFYGCANLSEVIIPDSVKNIGWWAFVGCTSLTNIKLGEGLVAIEDAAFKNCVTLKEIIIPDSIKYIGPEVFSQCSELENINIPFGVEEISSSTFSGCNSLTKINIPDSVTKIGSSAFYRSKKLMSVVIPDSVNNIDHGAFQECVNLKYVYFQGSEEQWNNIVVGTANENLLNANIYFVDDKHSINDWKVVIKATYKNEGKRIVKCTNCGEIINEEIIPMGVKRSTKEVNTGVTIDYDENGYESWLGVVSEFAHNNITESLAESIENEIGYIVRDINITVKGNIVQPTGLVTVKIPAPNGYNSNWRVYRLDTENGSVEKFESTCENGYVVFDTERLGCFALVEIADVDKCSCRCHKTGFVAKLIWKITLFFNKILRRNKVCACGIYHY